MKLPTVSLITVSYNSYRYIEQTIKSVLSQDYQHIEYIIIDGNSSDGTQEIIKKYQSKISYWVSEDDSGPGEAANKGLSIATGKYLWFINSDDYLCSPSSISQLVEFLESNPKIDFAYGDQYFVDQDNKKIGEIRYPDFDLQRLLKHTGSFPLNGCLLTRRAFEQIGGIDLSFDVNDDLEYYVRIALNFNMAPLGEFTACFRIADNRASYPENLYNQGKEKLRILDKVLNSPNCPADILVKQDKYWSIMYKSGASSYFQSGFPREFRQSLFSAITKDPSTLFDLKLVAKFVASLLGRQAIFFTRKYWKRQFIQKG